MEIRYLGEDETRENKILEDEIVNIGPAEIAKLLYPLRGTIGEIDKQLVERVSSELGIDNEAHAKFVVDYLEATRCVEKERVVKGPRGKDIFLYKLTPRGVAFTEDKRYL